jgi:23S rRNA pseudouridine2605 synthase
MAEHKRKTRRRIPDVREDPETGAAARSGSGEEGRTRLNKYIARAGVCSRRNADALIDQGRVKVNDAVVRAYWHQVEPGDVVEVNGRVISPSRFVYLLLNKPKDTITTTRDERGRRTVLDLVELPAEERAGLFPVGRLDRDTLGVLLLTNDGELAHRLMHPRYEVTKRYVVTTEKAVKPHEIDQLKQGVSLDDGLARADRATYIEGANRQALGLEIHEGRNRQVRRMLEALGHAVVSLERITYADLTTAGVRRGKWRRLTSHEVRRLRKLVHLK